MTRKVWGRVKTERKKNNFRIKKSIQRLGEERR
jgi:hypothetical protein